jgi:hypothetical protein
VAVDVPLARPVCALDAEQERREDAAVVGDPLGLDWAARAYSTRDVARVSTYSGSIVAIAFTATCRALGDKTPPPTRRERSILAAAASRIRRRLVTSSQSHSGVEAEARPIGGRATLTKTAKGPPSS